MLKREIKYTDFNDNEVTEIFYFNLSKPELIELELKYEAGFTAMIKRIVEANSNRELIQTFKEIILMAYGEKSDDGKRFIKNDELRTAFEQTAAYQELFIELATTDKAAVTFLTGIMPKDMIVNTNTSPGLEAVHQASVPTPGVEQPQG
jgi:hypothetical protein